MATNFHYKCNSWWFNYITGKIIMACPFTTKEKKNCAVICIIGILTANLVGGNVFLC